MSEDMQTVKPGQVEAVSGLAASYGTPDETPTTRSPRSAQSVTALSPAVS